MSESKALVAIAADPVRSLAFIETIGDRIVTSMKGVKSKPIATVVALQMLCEGLSPLEFERKYHILDGGGFAHRAEWVHAEMLLRGWNVKWTKDGEDGKEASAKFTRNGESADVSFTLEMAKKKGLIRGGSQWQNDPALMLRSRVITRAATMLEPGIGAGLVDDGEAKGSSVVESASTATTVGSVADAEFSSKPATAPATQPAKQESKPPSSPTTAATTKKPITAESMTSALDFSERAFEAFAVAPKISTLGMLCQFTREQLEGRVSSLKGVGKKKAADIVTDICIKLGEVGFDLKKPLAQGEGTEPGTETRDASSDDHSLAAKGDALANDSDANHGDNFHGQCLAEIRQICGDEKEKSFAKIIMGERCGGKTSLADLSAVESATVLIHLLGRQAGLPIEKVDGAVAKVTSAPVPIDAAQKAIAQVRSMLPKK